MMSLRCGSNHHTLKLFLTIVRTERIRAMKMMGLRFGQRSLILNHLAPRSFAETSGVVGLTACKTAEGSVFEPSRLVVQYPVNSYSELEGALDMTSNASRLYEPALASYPQPQSVSAQENFVQCTFSGDTANPFIPYDPSVHQSSFSTLSNALSESMMTCCHYS
jgi:hypothetical protein